MGKSCKNYAMKGSHFCFAHKGLFEDFPPVKITALICPYCDEPIKRGTKFCKLCKNFILICPYCDEPLRKDVKFCSFCKEDLIPATSKPRISLYYSKLIRLFNHSAAKHKVKSYDWFFAIIFLIVILFYCFTIWNLYFKTTSATF